MKMRRHYLLLLVPLLLAATPPKAPDTILTGGSIITMAGDEAASVEAILVREGRIATTGSLEEVKKATRGKAETVDLKGRTLLPGFIDAHGHMGFVGQNAAMAQLQPPPVAAVDSIAKLQEVLRDFQRPNGMPLIIGNGYDDSQLAERRHPTRADLDAVSATVPILLLHVSGHFGSMNSAMLKLVGYGPDTPDPQGGVIRREADGKTPNGVVEETAMYPIVKILTPPSVDVAIAPLIVGAKIYAANGITTGQDGRVMPESWGALDEAAKRGLFPIDVVALVSFEREWKDDVRARIGKGYNGNLRIGGIKLTLDGSPQGRTAWLKDPVPVPPDGQKAGYAGYPAIDLKLFNEKLADAAKNGWQVFAHVNGDAAAQALIDGVRANGLAGKRTIAIHSQVVDRSELEEMKALDIQPSFFANHTYYWGDWHRDVALGAKRADFISPQATAWSLGLRPSAHNDSPVVPPDMLRLVWSSVNRRTQSGDILGPLERISVYRALQQVTINAAWQIGEDKEKGSIEAGKRADLVLLDGNPLAVDPSELHKLRVVATIKDGKTVFGSLGD
ncbi:amidohydrolase [Sphingorhabdus sp.]|jgi:predicted amidohydrolase YtcJ|uniref:amidohydrolase n=1 Tax=Sphingorhabdus sp. TaxID=1902408 RepID=UPI003C74CDAC|nr:amidohydrolase [Sphingomonadales bacterium]